MSYSDDWLPATLFPNIIKAPSKWYWWFWFRKSLLEWFWFEIVCKNCDFYLDFKSLFIQRFRFWFQIFSEMTFYPTLLICFGLQNITNIRCIVIARCLEFSKYENFRVGPSLLLSSAWPENDLKSFDLKSWFQITIVIFWFWFKITWN